MALRGGYQIIDLQGNNITTGASFTIPGIYDLLESSMKPLLLSGIVEDGIEQADVYAVPLKTGDGTYQFYATRTYRILIASNDTITAQPLAAG